MSSAEGAGSLANVIGATIIDGYKSAPDSTRDFTRDVPLPSFKMAPITSSIGTSRPKLVGRGRTAEPITLQLQTANWRIARYGLQFAVDEQDLVDAAYVDLLAIALTQVGRAMGALRPDLVYSHLFGNDNLGDGVPLFDATRGNLGTSALADTSLDAALAAIAGQTLVDERGDASHINLSGRLLVVPPVLYGAGRRLANAMAAFDETDLKVVSESRLSTAGIVDPRSDVIVAGNDTNFLVAASSDQAPSIVVGHLEGQPEPDVRHFAFDRDGLWGIGVDVRFDVGVTAVDGRPLFWSTGAGE